MIDKLEEIKPNSVMGHIKNEIKNILVKKHNINENEANKMISKSSCANLMAKSKGITEKELIVSEELCAKVLAKEIWDSYVGDNTLQSLHD